MRQMTLSQNQLKPGGSRYYSGIDTSASQRVHGRYGAARSLDLLRMNVQSLVNRDIDALLKSYLQKYFHPALINIKKNLGEDSLTEHSLRVVCIEMLEDAKSQYIVRTPVENMGNSTNQQQLPAIQQLPKISSTADCAPRRHQNIAPARAYSLPNKSNSVMYKRQDVEYGRKKIMKTVTSILPGSPTPIKLVKLEAVRREGPKWDPNRINSSTLFIMGARANKVLGFGQTRGRLYTKHPELVKYSGDTEDKEWLSRNNLMPPTGGIAYLLLLDDIRELALSSDYRNNPNVLLHELVGFHAPDFMLVKIRAFMAQARTEEVDDNNYQHYDPCSFLQGLSFSGATTDMSPTVSNSESVTNPIIQQQDQHPIAFPQLSFHSSYSDQIQYF